MPLFPAWYKCCKMNTADCKQANIGALAGIWAHITAIFLVGSSISFISCFELKLIGPLWFAVGIWLQSLSGLWSLQLPFSCLAFSACSSSIGFPDQFPIISEINLMTAFTARSWPQALYPSFQLSAYWVVASESVAAEGEPDNVVVLETLDD